VVFPRPPAPVEPPQVTPTPREDTLVASRSAVLPRRRVDLVWFDVDGVPRTRAELGPAEEATDDRACMASVLSNSAREGVEDPIARAVDRHAGGLPALLVLTGELRFPFDARARLRAVVAGAKPLAKGDAELEACLDGVRELTDDGETCTDAQLIEAIRSVVAKRTSAAALTALDEGVERVLLRERCYQLRKVFGKSCIVAMFTRSGTRQLVPSYLPEEVASILPMYHALDVSLLAEAHLSQDQYEASPFALRVLALGRMHRARACVRGVRGVG
jgi:hypothetical protein